MRLELCRGGGLLVFACVSLSCEGIAVDRLLDAGGIFNVSDSDSGTLDGGAQVDGGSHVDAGEPLDAGFDAGRPFDAGQPFDAGFDAGQPFDAGSPFDWGDAGVPPWRRGLTPWQWVELPNSSLSGVGPTTSPAGSLKGRYDAWSGIAADPRTSRLYLAAAGGHADYAGNEAYTLDLNAPSPHWVLMREPSPESTLCVDCAYYSDGRPTSTHLYYTEHFIAATNHIMRFGAQATWGTGNGTFPTTDGYNLATNDWEPKDTWANIPSAGEKYGYNEAICKDPVTEEVYAGGATSLHRFTPSTGKWSVVGDWPNQGACAYDLPCAVDPVRGRVVYFGNHCLGATVPFAFDTARHTFQDVEFTGDAASVQAMLSAYAGMAYYDRSQGVFLYKTQTANTLLRVDPVTFVVTPQPTTGGQVPDAVNGVYTKFVPVPGLKGYAYVPSTASNVWFLTTE